MVSPGGHVGVLGLPRGGQGATISCTGVLGLVALSVIASKSIISVIQFGSFLLTFGLEESVFPPGVEWGTIGLLGFLA